MRRSKEANTNYRIRAVNRDNGYIIDMEDLNVEEREDIVFYDGKQMIGFSNPTGIMEKIQIVVLEPKQGC